MEVLYVVTAIVGGVLVVLSAIGHGSEDAHLEHEVDLGHGVEGLAGHDHGVPSETWIPFFSLRFWTYFCAAFGVIGLLLTQFSLAAPAAAALWAIAGGLAAGLGVSYSIRLLRRSESSSAIREQDLLGVEARMLVGARESLPGKARLSIHGEDIDLVAISHTGADIPAGETVYVLSIENNTARVARREDILD
jgi:membrane protein implicated in regulation of membrane protease activity